ncbi:uncharacterized protein LOC131246302 [Magnolia sinica]|uniref:uncharacterized protein LOC131246302 n=1 Tax=Magnolia sinica TaxID=86752 RepID=UPI00265B2D41|nr:uncharacterized protein LOC131246302 [Magnolia sinica]
MEGQIQHLYKSGLHYNKCGNGRIDGICGNDSEAIGIPKASPPLRWMGTYDVDQVELTYLKAKWILSFVMLWRKEVLSRLNSGRSKGSEPSKQIFTNQPFVAL